ncbi:hypothetical protein AKJ39_04885 [candidate division MSBL1 archaeon SCGC-AAA259J03]|uniref:3-octaprenyl-4-hydroxybenzoate carboxy-lyase-like Rift-related domain-containing protein n=1 Tax=candidate division MSBL1 archaeon SCGC-AAA259J03 TaxID=1698269 RepID=A0A656YUJ5_9EURY|nr:hypothetical protein AKJ39_04885 [candidate division MSBL1 archaeon SCGC-AAA259J03]
MKLVPAETSDLLVPANAEMVIEGTALPGERVDEGPCGEYLGFMHGPRRPMPLIRVDAITYRDNPIIVEDAAGTGAGNLGGIDMVANSFAASAPTETTRLLREQGVEASVPLGLAHWAYSIIPFAIGKQPYDGFTQDLETLLGPAGAAHYIDVHLNSPPGWGVTKEGKANEPEAVEPMFTLVDPENDINWPESDDMPKAQLNVYQTPEEKGTLAVSTARKTVAKVMIDASSEDWDEEENGPLLIKSDTLLPKEAVDEVEKKLESKREKVFPEIVIEKALRERREKSGS